MAIFRKLFELERAALREQLRAERAVVALPATTVPPAYVSSARERISQTLPACPGVWALRSPI